MVRGFISTQRVFLRHPNDEEGTKGVKEGPKIRIWVCFELQKWCRLSLGDEAPIFSDIASKSNNVDSICSDVAPIIFEVNSKSGDIDSDSNDVAPIFSDVDSKLDDEDSILYHIASKSDDVDLICSYEAPNNRFKDSNPVVKESNSTYFS